MVHTTMVASCIAGAPQPGGCQTGRCTPGPGSTPPGPDPGGPRPKGLVSVPGPLVVRHSKMGLVPILPSGCRRQRNTSVPASTTPVQARAHVFCRRYPASDAPDFRSVLSIQHRPGWARGACQEEGATATELSQTYILSATPVARGSPPAAGRSRDSCVHPPRPPLVRTWLGPRPGCA